MKKAILFVFAILLILAGCERGTPDLQVPETQMNSPVLEESPEPSSTPETEETPDLPEPTEEAPEESPEESDPDLTYIEPGQYKVGTDLEPGEYVLMASGSAGYFCVSSDANGDDILFNDNFETNSIITVNSGEYLKLTRCVAIDSEEFYAGYVVKLGLSGVMYKVGYDIPAGEYKIFAEEDQGYYCIYSSSRQDDIVANDVFENSAYATVTDGQYLLLSRCYIEE